MDKNSLERYFSPNQIRDRKREKARERQRKRRKARREQIEKQRHKDSSDEEFSLDFLQQTDQEQTPAPAGEPRGPLWDRLYRREYEACKKKRTRRQLQLEDAAAHSSQDVLTTTAEEAHDSSGGGRQEDSEHNVDEICSQQLQEDGLEKLAREFALIKCSSFVSDSALEKLFGMFMANAPLILALHNAGRISTSYLNTVKPTALKGVPTIMCAVYAHKLDENGSLQTVHERDLLTLSVEALDCKPPYKKIMWYDAYVELKEIVDLHIAIHLEKGMTMEEVHNTLKKCSLSIDGVVQARKGPRRFVVTALKIHNCIYLWRIVCPLIGDADSKLTSEDLCRWVWTARTCYKHIILILCSFCRWFVNQVNAERRITLENIVADMPERHDMKNLVGHQGFHACEYCRTKGMTAGKGGVFWPYPQCLPTQSSLRTHQQMKRMAR